MGRMENAENLALNHTKRISALEEQVDLLGVRGKKMTNDFTNVNWRLEKLEKGGGSGVVEITEDLDTGDHGR